MRTGSELSVSRNKTGSDSFSPDGIDHPVSLCMQNRVDLNVMLFGQKDLCSKQYAESVRCHMMLHILTGFPLFNQAENILVIDILKDLIAQTALFLKRWLNH